MLENFDLSFDSGKEGSVVAAPGLTISGALIIIIKFVSGDTRKVSAK